MKNNFILSKNIWNTIWSKLEEISEYIIKNSYKYPILFLILVKLNAFYFEKSERELLLKSSESLYKSLSKEPSIEFGKILLNLNRYLLIYYLLRSSSFNEILDRLIDDISKKFERQLQLPSNHLVMRTLLLIYEFWRCRWWNIIEYLMFFREWKNIRCKLKDINKSENLLHLKKLFEDYDFYQIIIEKSKISPIWYFIILLMLLILLLVLFRVIFYLL